MSTARSRPLPTSIDRTGAALVATLIALAGLGWVLTDQRMEGMDAGPGTDPGALGFFLAVWVVGMAAMMFPSVWPMVLIYARLQVRRRELPHRTVAVRTVMFVGGYLLAWTGFGLLGWAIYQAARGAGDALAWDHAGRWLTACAWCSSPPSTS